MAIQICVPKEVRQDEQRVALVPDVAKRLATDDLQINIQSSAGEAAGFFDKDYEVANIVADSAELLGKADINLMVNPPSDEQVDQLKEGSVLIGYLNPHSDLDRFTKLAQKNISAFSMELIPRISRAQAMDALSSQASIAGYKAVLLASNILGKFFPMLTTAAGTIRPSKILIIGAGVAGLQAIATARRLGAIVEGYDVRAATKEQVESLGAKFVDIEIKAEGEGGYARELTEDEKQQQQEILAKHVAASDVIVTTAAIPGRASPRIISTAMVEGMRGGSVIVDLAAEGGGNCELTKAGETVIHQGIKIYGPINVPSMVANHASELYAKNLQNFLELLIQEGAINIDLEDEIITGSLITHGGAIHHAGIKEQLEGAS
ncbi:MAG: Re/Si-specific NAD(P)(+) transhydrogenase subunit alpha [Gammaproteobacteria bacterium]|jgi:NAD(P) transhydrogenase subunit alpha|nr:Re/Si-specific NAD(P)(+) transhydrogenase subunit alpha [Gammaproteobacteria bacterium]MBT3860001.1 Re/Si-specific NAD(P)(+) transhydrogenase subunit alpha [Gammaproteobacteria bacterium]MBT3987049.1 Re/Si-specific NAD(P)(+) transhydrogenase subunit alpha [Gammaproteobacteria bacterium]MBT4256103.1 Re/Si-specific NAD(P)(+) transhydrogenase subunit alpha [Gammaproteobacteria bacterium]MBT4580686.1 Re/Si-specific NAD(P)(+) transhydrogenase subunit alpha [Gammaproteobacteria bacterium]